MSTFVFKTNQESDDFCKRIAGSMVELFCISREEAIRRINNQWRGVDLTGDMVELITHELPNDWAYIIYYGHGSRWWKRKDDPTLKPIPFP
ncbi:hypothetical protein [Paenibacillus alginolyticus]|uniref:Uncharacterized protein n=1 Tax=Paenibacillus alginolyticus TaxID=59839 RepID=A0ABT4GQB5_9BACL|nr:hypothetical protein [Paenibacillus alginolyticus]MCY9698413.1 hypothetical protein [Paenibacillus alginolyticus]MEC0143705.1 hypothetical protein [Paenibacillus alginolyticus]